MRKSNKIVVYAEKVDEELMFEIGLAMGMGKQVEFLNNNIKTNNCVIKRWLQNKLPMSEDMAMDELDKLLRKNYGPIAMAKAYGKIVSKRLRVLGDKDLAETYEGCIDNLGLYG